MGVHGTESAWMCSHEQQLVWITYIHMGNKKENLKMGKILSFRRQSLAVLCALLVGAFCPSQNGFSSLIEVLIHYFTAILCIPQELSHNRPML